MSERKQIIEDTIQLLQNAKYLMEKELEYGYSMTDELENIIDSLEFDLAEEQG